MQVLTENEMLLQKQLFAYKLQGLYVKDQDLFKQVSDYIPYFVYLNDQNSLNITYANGIILEKSQEMENLVERGVSYLPEISCPVLMKRAQAKFVKFKELGDKDATCSYVQRIQFSGKKKLTYTNKLILNDSQYLNISSLTDDLGAIGKVFKTVFKPLERDAMVTWQRFQSLTKQEKEILKLLGEGYSTKQISDMLFISTHTVSTHRKRINKKLDIENIAQLVRTSILLELI